MRFVGRDEQFAWLDRQLARAEAGQGRCVALRGRRQVGKSRLLTEWLRSKRLPTLYYQALDRPPELELRSFAETVAASSLRTIPELARAGTVWPDWRAAFEALAVAAGSQEDDAAPTIVILDEFPYLVARDPSVEGVLQAAWDHRLQFANLLLVLVGSDLAMMEALGSYGRPLYQRIDAHLPVAPLNIVEVAELLDIDATEAFDTYLITGGFPKVVAARTEHSSDRDFLAAAVTDEAHPLVFTGQQTLAAEFPPRMAARSVLEAIGAGERAFGAIQTRADVSERTLAQALRELADKGVIAATDPRSARPVTGRTRYAIADPYLRFWLRFLSDRIDDIARGRGDLVLASIEHAWPDYAGAAVEPLVREGLERLLPDESRFGTARYLGSYWTRSHDVQVDLVGTEEAGPCERVALVGSIKWRVRKCFDPDDAKDLAAMGPRVPGVDDATLTVGVSRTGFTKDVSLDVMLTPEDVLTAWQR